MKNLNSPLLQSVPQRPNASHEQKAFRFEIFKGQINREGKVIRSKSVGGAHLVEGQSTHSLYIKTFINDVFYLLPNKSRDKFPGQDYVILTREPGKNSGRKYFWNGIGGGTLLDGVNSGLVKLSWDFLGVDDIYLNLTPKETTFETEVSKGLRAELNLKA